MPIASRARIRSTSLAVAVASLTLAMPGTALAVNTGLEATARAAQLSTTMTIDDRIAGIISAALGFVGVLFLVLMIYGGFKWMTSGGDSKQADEAKQIFRNAVIGLVLILSAYAITELVFRALQPQPAAVAEERGPDMEFSREELDCLSSGGDWWNGVCAGI